MKQMSIVGEDQYWGKQGAFWGGLWGMLFGALFVVPGLGSILVPARWPLGSLVHWKAPLCWAG